MALQPAVVDVPLATLNALPPDHAGPTGRMIEMFDAIVRRYSENGQKRISIDPRNGFSSLTDELRASATGLVESGTWANPSFLAALGDQLLSICTNRPRVFSGSAWTNYGTTRVVTQKLSQSVLHAANGTIAAPDHAYISGTTCTVWTEQTYVNDDSDTVLNTTAWLGFRADDGAWLRTPTVLQTAAGASNLYELAKVVSDGAHFWVFYNAEATGPKILVDAYGIFGNLVATTLVARVNPASPAVWDVKGGVWGDVQGALLAQQNSLPVDPGDDLGVRIQRFTYNGATIDIETSNLTAAHCQGQVAWLTNDLTGSDEYLATLGPAEAAGGKFWAYEIDEDLAISHEYNVNVEPVFLPDSITGWAEEGVLASQRTVYLSYSMLASEITEGGPPYDPQTRATHTRKCTFADVSTHIRTTLSVIQQSRAFAINGEYHAYTYYASGSGQLLPSAVEDYEAETGDMFIGAPVQPLEITGGGTYGAPTAAQPLGMILIYVGMTPKDIDDTGTPDKVEQVLASSMAGIPDGTPVLKWTFKNATFPVTYGGAMMDIDGASIAGADGRWDVLQYTGLTIAYTPMVSRAGGTLIPGNFAGSGGTGGTVEIVSTTFYSMENIDDVIPQDVESLYAAGNITISGAANGANNDTFTLLRIARVPTPFANNAVGGIWVETTTQVTENPTAAQAVLATNQPYVWFFSGEPVSDADIGSRLNVSGNSVTENNGSFLVTDVPTGTSLETDATEAAGTTTQFFDVNALPELQIEVVDPGAAYTLTVDSIDFDFTYVGALLTIDGAGTRTDGVYKITDILGAHSVRLAPTDGVTTHRSWALDSSDTIFIQRQGSVQPQTQPTWFITPLTGVQPQVGCFEKGLAFADWRFDGESTPFAQNRYRFALSSTSNPFGTIRQVVLPYRVSSFTQVSVATVGATQLDIANVAAASTVGLKSFRSQGRGEGTGDAGKLLVPGLLATEFTASGFAENNFNVGPEAPFVQELDEDNTTFALTPGATYIYAVTVARQLENGDTVRSLASPPITVQLTGANNVVVLGGRTLKPLDTDGTPATGNIYGVTNHAAVTYEIWRTVVVDGAPSATLHLVTDPGNPNGIYEGTGTGSGFSFPDVATWNYRDENPDAGIRATEVFPYGSIGQGIAPHFPCPPFTHATTWANRRWVVGYDGAVWMSAELVEGEDTWFFPGFRYPFPPEDPCVCVVGFENFLFMLCAKSIWRIPFTQLPNATLTAGTMPTPVRLPFAMGCSGFAVAMADSVAYSSSVNDGRQVWVITRNLANVYLSEPIEDDITQPVSAMAVDGQQKLLVAAGDSKIRVFDPVSREWSPWRMPSTPDLVTSYLGQPTYQDSGFVMQQSDAAIVDTRDEAESGVAIDVTLANLSFAQVRAVKRLWEAQIVGTRNGPCNINASISYPDDTNASPTTFGPEAVTDDPILLAINPAEEDATSFRIRVFGSYEDVEEPGRCFSLEMLSCEVGLDSSQGLRKLPNGFRLVGGS